MRRLTAAALAGAMVMLNGCTALLSDGVDTGQEQVHDITSGTAFGVTIGMGRDDAKAVLLGHWGTHLTQSGACSGKDCQDARDEDDFRTSSGLTGETIQVFSRNGLVVRVAWYENPLDF